MASSVHELRTAFRNLVIRRLPILAIFMTGADRAWAARSERGARVRNICSSAARAPVFRSSRQSFCSAPNCTDGKTPVATLILDPRPTCTAPPKEEAVRDSDSNPHSSSESAITCRSACFCLERLMPPITDHPFAQRNLLRLAVGKREPESRFLVNGGGDRPDI